MDALIPILRELLDTLPAKLLEPNPIVFKRGNLKGVPPLQEFLRSGTPEIYSFRRSLARNDFLLGCLNWVYEQAKEHLIVGFGYRHGPTTRIVAAQHIEGEVGQVSIPTQVLVKLSDFVLAQPRAELLLFHNHPANWLRTLINNAPLPSSADRKVLLDHRYRNPVMLLKELLGNGTLRCYLAENGKVQEFRAPGLLQILEQLGIHLPNPHWANEHV
jgi:hypothetical protein